MSWKTHVPQARSMRFRGTPIAGYVFLALIIFVCMHSFLPNDPRTRLGFKDFEIDWSLSPRAIWISAKKWRHVLWFVVAYPIVYSLHSQSQALSRTTRTWLWILGVSLLIEAQQTVIAGRFARVTDLVPNVIGAGLGWVMVMIWTNSRTRG